MEIQPITKEELERRERLRRLHACIDHNLYILGFQRSEEAREETMEMIRERLQEIEEINKN